IHIGAQGGGLTGLCAADDADDAGLRRPAMLDAEPLQFGLDQRLRARLLEAQLRVAVDRAPQFDHARENAGSRKNSRHSSRIGKGARQALPRKQTAMLPPDVALVQLINRTAAAFAQNAPAYITYVEHTHISSPGMNRTQDINRSVQVRQADDFAVMQDLPHGAERTGQAFPIIPYFDPLGQGFGFSWYANLKNVQISLQRYPVGQWPVPQPDPSVNLFVPYASFWDPSYLPDSTESRPHFRIVPTPAYAGDMCVWDVVVDPQTHLPSHIELRS